MRRSSRELARGRGRGSEGNKEKWPEIQFLILSPPDEQWSRIRYSCFVGTPAVDLGIDQRDSLPHSPVYIYMYISIYPYIYILVSSYTFVSVAPVSLLRLQLPSFRVSLTGLASRCCSADQCPVSLALRQCLSFSRTCGVSLSLALFTSLHIHIP